MKKNVIILSALILSAFNQAPSISKMVDKATSFAAAGKKIMVYYAADISGLKLTLKDNLSFKGLALLNETQVCVFVDQSETFQTFLRMGAALTDTFKETFTKLSKAKQQEFLVARNQNNIKITYNLCSGTKTAEVNILPNAIQTLVL